jgi:hypothetical protein
VLHQWLIKEREYAALTSRRSCRVAAYAAGLLAGRLTAEEFTAAVRVIDDPGV